MSVASEITRIQNAKTSLKASINAKTDSEHQITNELIDDYADFVDSISTGTHTGAYKVNSVEEMNAITDMAEGNYCIVAPPIQTTATFTKFTGTPTDLLNGVYSDYAFVIVFDYRGDKVLTDDVQRISRYGPESCMLEDQTFTDDQITYELNDANKKYMFTLEHTNNNTLAIKSLNNKYIKTGQSAGANTYYSNTTTDFNSVDTFIGALDYLANGVYDNIKIKDASGSDYGNGMYLSTYFSSKSALVFAGNNMPVKLYACYMPKQLAYTVYKYENSTWVNVTDDILVETTNVTPSTSSQTLSIPAGYEGFKEVNISAVDNTIDSNIIAENIKDGVTILGVTGTYTGE